MVNWGVRWIFGMLGHSNLGLGEAIRKKEAGGSLRFISIRHEGAASFACSAYGKLTRRLSACLTIAGYGAIPAAQIVVKLAETLNCPLITTYKSKGLIPDSHPLACGVVGRSGTPVAARFMIESDCLVVLGAGFSAHSGISRNKPAIQVDFDPSALARFNPVTVPVWGDIGKTVELMLDSLDGNDLFEDRRPDIVSEWEAWRREKRKRSGANNGTGLSSAVVYEVLGRVTPGDALITIDVGDNAYSFGRYFESQSQPVIMSGYLGSIGFSFPAAMGAWAASQEQDSEFHGRKVISVSGDGGFAQYMGEFLTAVKYGMNITHLLLNNNELGKIAKEQKGENYEVWNTSLNNLDFAAYANSCGALGFKVESTEDLESALVKAIKYPGPSLVEVAVDASLT